MWNPFGERLLFNCIACNQFDSSSQPPTDQSHQDLDCSDLHLKSLQKVNNEVALSWWIVYSDGTGEKRTVIGRVASSMAIVPAPLLLQRANQGTEQYLTNQDKRNWEQGQITGALRRWSSIFGDMVQVVVASSLQISSYVRHISPPPDPYLFYLLVSTRTKLRPIMAVEGYAI